MQQAQRKNQALPFDGNYTFTQSWLVIREWFHADTVWYMKRKAMEYFTNRLAVWLSVIVVFAHWWWARHSQCSTNFARGGAAVTAIVATLFAVTQWYEDRGGKLSGGEIPRFRFYNPNFLFPLLAGIGTAIWGYGDLLPYVGSIGCP